MNPGPGAVVGIDAGCRSRDEVEHLIGRAVSLLAEPVLACTHIVRTPAPHWAAAIRSTGPLPTAADLSAALDDAAVCVLRAGAAVVAGAASGRVGAELAAADLLAGRAARAVFFEGQDRLPDVVPVDDLPGLCAIDEIVGLAGTPVAGQLLHTRGLVRPELVDGRLVLLVRPYGDDLAPFEVPNPTPCCAAHG